MILAILLARATAATLKGRLASNAFNQGLASALFRAIRRTDLAPTTNSERIYGFPIFNIRPSRSFPPDE